MDKKIKLVIVDDNEQYVEGLKIILNQDDIHIQFTATNLGTLFMSLDRNDPPNVLLLDIDLNGINSISHIDKIKALLPLTKIIIVTGLDSPTSVQKSLKKGVDGFVQKAADPTNFLMAIREVNKGNAYLDPRSTKQALNTLGFESPFYSKFGLSKVEEEIVVYLTDGLSYKMIGDRIGISLDSVRYYIKGIYKKMKVNSKVELFKKLRNT